MIKKISVSICYIFTLFAAEMPTKLALPKNLIQTSFAHPTSGSHKSYYLPKSKIVCAANLFLSPEQAAESTTTLETIQTKLFEQIPFAQLPISSSGSLSATIAQMCQKINSNNQPTQSKAPEYIANGHVWFISHSHACMIQLKATEDGSIKVSQLRVIDTTKKAILSHNIKNIQPDLKSLCEDILRLTSQDPDSFSTNSRTVLDHIKKNNLQTHHAQSMLTLVEIKRLRNYIKEQEQKKCVQTFVPKNRDRSPCCLWPFFAPTITDYEELTNKE